MNQKRIRKVNKNPLKKFYVLSKRKCKQNSILKNHSLQIELYIYISSITVFLFTDKKLYKDNIKIPEKALEV
jgi:hypothetical protein